MKTKKLKILIATGIYPPDIGGPAIYALRLKEGLQKRSKIEKIDIVTYGEKDEKKKLDGIYVINRSKNILFKYFDFFMTILKLSKNVDIIYTLDLISAGMPAMLVAKIRKKKIIFRTGGDFLWEKYVNEGGVKLPLEDFYKKINLKRNFLFKFSKFVLNSFDKVIFSTHFQANIYRKYYGLKEKKITFVENAFPRLPESVSNKKRYVVSAGRLVKLKNLERLLEAIKDIDNIKLLIFGEGPEKENLKKKVKDLKIIEKVEIKKGVTHKELMSIIMSNLFFVLPSLTEISPNLALECLSLGRPLVLTRNNGLGEDVNRVAVLIDPMSVDDIRKKINYMLNNLEKEESRVKDFKIKIREWEEVVDDNLKIIQDL